MANRKKVPEGYASIDWASKAFSIYPEMVQHLVETGDILSQKDGDHLYVEVDSLERLFKSQKDSKIKFGNHLFMNLDSLFKFFNENEPNGMPHSTTFGKIMYVDVPAMIDYLKKQDSSNSSIQ